MRLFKHNNSTFPLLLTSLFGWLIITAGTCTSAQKQISSSPASPVNFEIKGIAVSAPIDKIDSTNLQSVVNAHANSIAVIPYAFCKMPEAKVQYNHGKQWWGERDEGVKETIRMAHEQGLTVMLKPHLWFPGGMYTGKLIFTNDVQAATWENSYTEYIIHFAKLAEQSKVNIFCIGTELGGVAASRPQYFHYLIDSVRKYYSGKITYAANWDDYKQFPSWADVDFIGVDAYFPLSKNQYPTIPEIEEEWDKLKPGIKNLSDKYKKKILFAEYGYRNTAYTTKEPWAENEKERYDQGQADALAAFYNSFSNEKWFAGGYLWKWYVDKKQLDYSGEIDFTPQGKKALQIVQQYYK